jgi:molybdopterin-guanine dinucleotide biosynthesis protein A
MKTEPGNPPNGRKAASVSGILLAGGKSRRMGGVTKGLMEVGGRPIAERVAATLKGLFDEVLLITNSPEEYRFLGLPMFGDRIPGYGSLGGLYTGLSVCSGEYGFLVPCDMPFLRQDVISYMLDQIDGQDVIVPRIRGWLEPLHALYSRRCIPFIEDGLGKGDLKIINFFDRAHLLEIPEEDFSRFDPEFRFIMNVNTPEDLSRARGLVQELNSARS